MNGQFEMADMNNQADAPQDSWYLISRKGDLTARVRSGMRIGEDETGVMSLLPDDALIVIDISERGTLILRPVSAAHEFIVARRDRKSSVEIGHEIRAEIFIASNTLLIDKDFATTSRSSSIMRLELAESLTAEDERRQVDQPSGLQLDREEPNPPALPNEPLAPEELLRPEPSRPELSRADLVAEESVDPEASEQPRVSIDPKPKPKPKPRAKAEPKAKVEPEPKAKVEPKSKAKVEPKPKAKAKAKAEPKPKARAEPKPKAKAEPKPKAKAEPIPKAERKPKAKVEPKPKPKAEPKPKPKAEAEPAAKPKPKPVAEPAVSAPPKETAATAPAGSMEATRPRNARPAESSVPSKRKSVAQSGTGEAVPNSPSRKVPSRQTDAIRRMRQGKQTRRNVSRTRIVIATAASLVLSMLVGAQLILDVPGRTDAVPAESTALVQTDPNFETRMERLVVSFLHHYARAETLVATLSIDGFGGIRVDTAGASRAPAPAPKTQQPVHSAPPRPTTAVGTATVAATKIDNQATPTEHRTIPVAPPSVAASTVEREFSSIAPLQKASDQIAKPWGVTKAKPIRAAPLQVADTRSELSALEHEFDAKMPLRKASDEVSNPWSVEDAMR